VILLAAFLACSPTADSPGGGGGSDDSGSHTTEPPAIEVEVAPSTVPLVQTVDVTAPAEAALEVLCTDDGGAGDEMVVTDAGGKKKRQLTITGLLADASYTCTVTSGETEVGFDFATPALTDAPQMTLGGDGTADGYTLFYHLIADEKGKVSPPAHLYVVDPLGRVRWDYVVGNTSIDIDAHLLDGQQILYGGALRVPPTVVGVDHTPILQFESDERFHHQIEPLSGGRILTLTEIENTDGVHTWIGFLVSVRELQTLDILWSWSSQTGVDAGVLPISNQDGDPYHANSAQLLEGDDEPRLMLVSLRNLSRILAIDTDTGDVVWTIGPDGDFALVDAKGVPLPDEQWFEGQHSLEAHWPRVLMFDNGPQELRSDGTSSRALEIEIDTANKLVKKTWSYADGSAHEALGGDANRLASGNVLITIPHWHDTWDERSKILEVTPDGDVVWRLDFGDDRDLLYRAERIDPCALFSNRAYCPSL
jgi:hypothetical protein